MRPEQRQEIDALFDEIAPELDKPIHEPQGQEREDIDAEFRSSTHDTIPRRVSGSLIPKALPPHK